MTKNIYEELSQERKTLVEMGHLPEWTTTAGWQLFKSKYMHEAPEAFKSQARRIADTAAKHLAKEGSKVFIMWSDEFFKLIWNGWLSCSTPVLANMGTDRGLPVSCSGGYIEDSIDGFYKTRRETALLTKYGFGTSGYFGDVRPRGASISRGGKASGILPIIKGFVQDSRDVSQGNTRRGAWAGYVPIDHGDFYELCSYLEAEPDDVNIGWNISDAFYERLQSGEEDAIRRYQKAMKLRCTTGKGYFFFVDKANRHRPECYKKNNLDVKASQLCTEITLHSSKEYTYTCVLSSMNYAKYDEWQHTNAIFVATVFLDCVASEFIQRAKSIDGLEKAVAFTENSRALGLGACGFHTLLQLKSIPIESFEAHSLNNVLFKELHDQSLAASKWLAQNYGEPKWLRGTGLRNSHRTAIAPTMSTALIMGGVSQGIEPVIGNVFMQGSAAGEMERINPVFLSLMKERGKYDKRTVDRIANNLGSVQGEDWLSDHEKNVFKTAYEIDQRALIRLAATRQQWLCQGQSLNLFFSADESEEYISQVHKEAFQNENILSLYYLRSMAGVQASKNECVACQ